MQAEPGAVTSRPGLVSPGLTGAAGGPSASARKLRCQGGTLHGPDGRADIILRLDQGPRETPQSGREERPDANTTPRWSAGRRAPSVTGRARLARRACYNGSPVGAPLPLPYGRRGKKRRTRLTSENSGVRSVGFLPCRRLFDR